MSTTPTVRVLHVLDSLAPGGLENGVVNVAQRLNGQGFDIHSACLRFRGDFAERMPEPAKVVVMGKTGGFSPKAVLALRKHIRKTRAEVIHSHNLGTLIYAALATLGGLTHPIVHGEHGQVQKQDLTPKRLAQRRWFFRLCHSVHVVSSSVRDNLQELGLDPQKKIVVTPNGVDSERFSPAPDRAVAKQELGLPGDAIVVGIVGRLVALKRHEMLFAAFEKLAPQWPSLRLLVVGDGGADRDHIIGLMKAHPYADRILWAGHQNDLPKYYRAMDLLAAPSEIEGLSNAVLEAMACAVPVLAHSACGNAEVIEDGLTGFLSDIHDVHTLAACIESPLKDSALLARCGAGARETVLKRYSMEAMADCYRRLYRDAAGK
ncbi:MAG: glycosyltransferase [Verrucomicrobiota bacterium]